MSTDRSDSPFPSFDAAAEAVLTTADASGIARRLLATLRASEARAAAAEAEAATDVLTGAGSRRHWERLLAAEEARCARYGRTACVVAIDLDGLKAINDRDGHRAGDAELCRVASALARASRASDVLARVGGDEFAVLAVDTDLRTGRVLSRRLADALEAAGVTASLGLAERGAGGLAAAWTEADSRMYAAKRRRRREAQEMAPLDASASTMAPSTTR